MRFVCGVADGSMREMAIFHGTWPCCGVLGNLKSFKFLRRMASGKRWTVRRHRIIHNVV